MAWQRRMRNAAGPFMTDGTVQGGSGEQPTGLPQVELYLGGGWVDATALGLVRYQQGIKTTRGQPDENQRTNPGTATFRLNNRDGRFSPRNPLGPYYGQIDRNTPCRISVPSGNAKSYRFWGEVSSWPADWDTTGNDAWVDIQAAGILRRLGQGTAVLDSPMTASISRTGTITGLVAYWPCEDGSQATQIAAGIAGVQPMVISGSPTLASNSDFACSAPLPAMNTGQFIGNVPAYTSTGTVVVRFLLEIPSAGLPDLTTLATLATTGSIKSLKLVYGVVNGGAVQLQAYDGNGNSVGTVGFTTLGQNGTAMNGQLVRMSIELKPSGSSINASLATLGPGWALAETIGSTWTSSSVGRIQGLTIAPGGGMGNAVVGQITVQSVWTSLFDVVSQLSAYSGEHAGDRIGRLCGEAGIAYEEVGGNSVPMGPQPVDTFLNVVQQCVDADGGILFELTDQLGLGYRTRDALLNQTPVLTLDYPSAQLADVPRPVDDDTYTRNDITITRTKGSSTRAQQLTGPCNMQQPPTGVGQYQTQATINCQTDAQTADIAGWLLHLGTVAEPRYPVLGVQLAASEIASSTTLRSQILAVSPGDRVTVSNPPAWLPPDPISELVIGYTETFDQFTHHIRWNTRPESPFRVAVADDPVYGHADTDGSTLAAPAQATDTVLQVATTNVGSPLWTTNVSDYPFDLAVGGERITAWGCGQPLGSIDGTFESGVTGWTATGCTLASAPGFSHSGSQSGLMTVTGSPTQAYIRPDTSHNAPVSPSATYQATMWVYSPVALANVTASIDWLDSGEAYISTSSGSTVTLVAGLWTPLTVSATAVASSAFARGGPTIAGSPANGTQLWVDDYLLVNPNSFQTSPQTLAVIRSVNGVVKVQAQNTAVQLWQPATVAM
jgi:hypothetical protein